MTENNQYHESAFDWALKRFSEIDNLTTTHPPPKKKIEKAKTKKKKKKLKVDRDGFVLYFVRLIIQFEVWIKVISRNRPNNTLYCTFPGQLKK